MAGRNIAMWSGPRNLSTAMMRAFGNRSDTRVIDEPFYAHFLHATGIDHPMRDAIIAAGEIDWRAVVDRIAEPPAAGRVCYQKHITTHWQPDFATDWLAALDHAFLIRSPSDVVASYDVKRKGGTALDLGYPQQAALFDLIAERADTPPPVIDCDRFLADPEAQLRALCVRLELGYESSMLAWPAGARDTDGVWGAHWYDAVNRSTGFQAPRGSPASLDALAPRARSVAQACEPYYRALLAHAL